MQSIKPAYEITSSRLDEFLELLERREAQPGRRREPLPRRVVCVEGLCDLRPTELGVPYVRRRVVAGFAVEGDLVRVELVSSEGYEHPHEREELEERQARLLQHVREALRDKIDDLGLSVQVPVIRGTIRTGGPGAKGMS